jgi:hypothetical protein
MMEIITYDTMGVPAGQGRSKIVLHPYFKLQNLGNGKTKSIILSEMALNTCHFPDLIFFQPNFYVLRLFSSLRKYIFRLFYTLLTIIVCFLLNANKKYVQIQMKKKSADSHVLNLECDVIEMVITKRPQDSRISRSLYLANSLR